MKSLKIFVLILSSVILFSCSKSDDKKTNVDDKKTNQTNVDKKSQDNQKPYFTVTNVEDGQKGILPNIEWEENGNKVSTSNFKGKVLFLNFYATWCGPCKKEIPDLKEIYSELKDKDFRMFGINIFPNQGAQSLDDFLKTYQLNYTALDGNEKLVKSISDAIGEEMSAVPTTIIVNKEGKIVEKIIGSKSKEQFLELIKKYL